LEAASKAAIRRTGSSDAANAGGAGCDAELNKTIHDQIDRRSELLETIAQLLRLSAEGKYDPTYCQS
jgi:hypothetical protein